jgi:hypothetical protein
MKEYINETWYKDENGIIILDVRQCYVRVWWDTTDPNHHCWWGRARNNSSWKWYELNLSHLTKKDQRDDALQEAQTLLNKLEKQGY